MKDHDSNASDLLDPADPVNRDSVSDSWGRAAAYDAYADGLHTYALGGLRNHEAAASAVYCTFLAADHHVAHLGDAEMLRPWLYAITRHYCRAGKLPRMRLAASGTSGAPGTSAASGASRPSAASPKAEKGNGLAELERSLLSAELASLDWPDTDGLTAAHREVLELSVRHGMESRAVGLILGKPAAESFELLSAAWHELERSLAATALLRTTREHCSDLAALAEGWNGRLTAQRREPLVAHVDVCSRCQFHLHKVVGAPQAPSILPHVPAPRELRERVLGDLLDSSAEKEAEKAAIAGRLTRFDALGFPTAEAMAPLVAEVAESAESAEGSRSDATAERGRRGLLGRGRGAAAAAAVGVASGGLNDVEASAEPAAQPRRRGGAPTAVMAAVAAEAAEAVPAPRRRSEAPTAIMPVVAADSVPLARQRNDARTAVMPVVAAEGAAADLARGTVFEDVRADRAASGPAPRPRRNSVAAAVEGRRRGIADAKSGAAQPRQVSDSYEAAALVAAAVAAEDPSAGQAPRISPAGGGVGSGVGSGGGARRPDMARRPAAGAQPSVPRSAASAPPRPVPSSARAFTRPAPVPPRRRKSTFRSALASSAVLSGVSAAGVTAFVLFVPSSASNTTLYTPPDHNGGNSTQLPDYPRPSSTAGATGPAVPVAGGAKLGGGPLPGADAVTAQVVAAVLPQSGENAPGAGSGRPTPPPFGGPMQGLPSATASAGPVPIPNPGTPAGQLNISVAQRSNTPGETTVTLWNSGPAPVSWTATPDSPWIHISAVSGIIAPGAQTTMRIVVDRETEPTVPWQAHVRFDPSGQTIALSGVGNPGTPGSSPSTTPTSGSSSPSGPPSSHPSTPPSTPPGTPPSSSPSSTPSSGPSTGPSSSAPSSTPSSSPPSASPSSATPTGTPRSRPTPTGSRSAVPTGTPRSRPTATGSPSSSSPASAPSGTGSGSPTGTASGSSAPAASPASAASGTGTGTGFPAGTAPPRAS